jgi:glycerate 2-kinase
MPDRPLIVLVAPDSFKGSLTSVEVARALADGWRRARPSDRLELAPLADGGEGTLLAMEAAGGWTRRTSRVLDPRNRQADASWLLSEDGTTAAIEMAEASGLSRLSADELRPLTVTSAGTGELVRAALDAGVSTIILGIGGSATNDGGAGVVFALGGAILDKRGKPLSGEGESPPAPASLGNASVRLDALDPRLARVDIRVACDVTNPLLGPTGASAVFGPQKGATASDIPFLDDVLAHWADALEAATGRRERDMPGAGAAGGLGFALLCLQDRFRSFELRPGVELVMDATGFDAKLRDADLVITGEGRIDAQTAFGKTALGVARGARAAGTPCIAVGGGVDVAGIEALAAVGAVAVPVVEQPQPLADAIAAGTSPLERCGERLARLVTVGAGVFDD